MILLTCDYEAFIQLDLIPPSSAREVPKGSKFAYFAETKFCFGGSEIKIMESGSKEAGGSDIHISAVFRP